MNTVLHYIHCSETPDIPQQPPINTDVIETIVRRIMEECSHETIRQDARQTPEKKRSNPKKSPLTMLPSCWARMVWLPLGIP